MSLSVFIIECVIFMAVFGVAVFGMMMVSPLTFISDYPPEIQEQYYTSQHKQKTRQMITTLMLAKKIIALIAVVFVLAWMAHMAGAQTFGQGLLLAYGYMLVWIAFDTFFLNWVLFVNIQKIRLPGTEDMDREYHQKWFHVKVLLPMLPVFALGGILIATLMVWLW